MFEGFAGVGGYTWAVIILLVVMMIGSFLATKGLIGFLAGGLLAAAAFGAMVEIIAFRDSRIPVVETSWGMTAAMAILATLAVNLLANWKNIAASGAGPSLRNRVPDLNTRAVAALTAGTVLLAVSLGFFVNNLDLTLGDSNRGAEIAEEEFANVNNGVWRNIERFLAR